MARPIQLPLARSAQEAADLKQRWLEAAFERAGIDPEQWQPARGTDANRATIEAIYAYYGRLFLDDARCRWAGMAAMVGPSFYAAFLDLGAFPDAVRRAAAAARELGAWLRRDELDAELSEEGLGFLEFTFLTMQRKIFEDQAPMHEAFRGGGVAAIGELERAGLLDAATRAAWEQIASGDPSAVDAGNRTLLWREQYTIIDRFYRQMRDYQAPVGAFLTYAMTLAGSPSIRGARGYTAVFPLTLHLALRGDAQHRELRFATPLAAGNIADFHDRWALIESDTLPTYLRLLRDQPEQVRTQLEAPLAQRVGAWRITRQLPALTKTALLGWRVSVTAAERRPAALPNAIDLSTPSAFASSSADAIFTSHDVEGVPLTVLLPAATLDVRLRQLLVHRDAAARVNQVIVKLPSAPLEAATATAATILHELDPSAALADAGGDDQLAPAETYRTSVVARLAIADWLRTEIQLEHHFHEQRVVVDILFSVLPGDRARSGNVTP